MQHPTFVYHNMVMILEYSYFELLFSAFLNPHINIAVMTYKYVVKLHISILYAIINTKQVLQIKLFFKCARLYLSELKKIAVYK